MYESEPSGATRVQLQRALASLEIECAFEFEREAGRAEPVERALAEASRWHALTQLFASAPCWRRARRE